MFLKRKIICALNIYEDLPAKNRLTSSSTRRHEGITQGAFIKWFRKQDKNNKYDYEKVDKCINDCIEDGYINRKEKKGILEATTAYISGGFFSKDKIDYIERTIENIYVSSTGRDFIKKYFFYLKYLPETFSDLKIILFTFIGTIITSPFWSPVIEYMGRVISNLLNYV